MFLRCFGLQQCGHARDVFVERAVVFKFRRNAAHGLVKFFEIAAHDFFAAAQIRRLHEGERFDGENFPQQRQGGARHFRRDAAHADDILIVGVRGNGLDRSGACRAGALRRRATWRAVARRETGIQTGRAARKHRRQAATVTPVDEPLDLPFGEQRHFDEADAHVVADHRDLLAVKISAVDDHVGVGKNQRVVRAGVEFARDDFLDVPVRFLKRAENLRRAAQRIRVLDFRARIHRLGLRAPLVLVNALGENRDACAANR